MPRAMSYGMQIFLHPLIDFIQGLFELFFDRILEVNNLIKGFFEKFPLESKVQYLEQ